jgi:hypothetical protein
MQGVTSDAVPQEKPPVVRSWVLFVTSHSDIPRVNGQSENDKDEAAGCRAGTGHHGQVREISEYRHTSLPERSIAKRQFWRSVTTAVLLLRAPRFVQVGLLVVRGKTSELDVHARL